MLPGQPLRALARPLRRSCAVAAATVAVAAAGAAPAFAADVPTTYVTMVGGGDPIGGTLDQLFHPGNTTITVSGTASYLQVQLSGGAYAKQYTVVLGAPEGQVLAPGAYESAAVPPEAGRPSILVDETGGDACYTSTGRFVVHDVAVGGDGVVSRFAGTFEHHCGHHEPSLIGQVVVNQPRDAAVLVAGDLVAWPALYPERAGRVAPVWVHNRGTESLTVTGATVDGPGAAAFAVTANTCGTLAPGETCAVSVRFDPPGGGAYDATLTIAEAAGPRTVSLVGQGIPGHTALYLRSETGEFVGGGQRYDLLPTTTSLAVSGGPGQVRMHAADGDWDVTLEPAPGGSLVPGTYQDTTEYLDGPTPLVDVSGAGHGCSARVGTFTVVEAAYTEAGTVERFAATFEHYCDGATVALFGWVSWRATAPNVPPAGPAPAVTGLTAYADVASVLVDWANPAGVRSVIVRGANGLTAPATTTAGWRVYTGRGSAVHVGYLAPGASYSFAVFTKDVAGNLGPRRTVTVRGSALTLTRGASTITYGGGVRITVRLVDAANGAARAAQDVDLFARPTGGREFGFVKRLRTGSTGTASVVLAPARGYEFQAVYYGSGKALGASAGPAGVAVRARVTASLSRTSVARGGSVTVSGSVGPDKPGRTVYLQRYVDGAWRTLASKTLSAASRYAFALRPGTAGTWRLRVYRPADAANAAGWSATRALTVT